MNRTALMLTIGLSGLTAGCSAFQPRAELNIRTVDGERLANRQADPLSAGRSHLALGQNGLAVSAFRAALRQQPASAEANNGLAIAYDRIGRKDLAQRYFELAVAAAPADSKYSGNLARFLESSGRPQMALGLSRPDAVVAAAEPVVENNGVPAPVVQQLPPMIALAESDAAILAIAPPLRLDLPVPQVASLIDLPVGDQPLPEQVFDRPAAKAVAQFAVFRPAAPVAIRAAAIDPASLPVHPGQPLPGDQPAPTPFGAPRMPSAPAQREGMRLERVSLGEVRLVTRLDAPLMPKPAGADFNSFGARLATWLPDAIADEHGARLALSAGPVLRQALARARLEQAVAEAAVVPAVAPQMPSFTYAFFDDDRLLETSLAAL